MEFLKIAKNADTAPGPVLTAQDSWEIKDDYPW